MDASDITSDTLIKWGATADRWKEQDTAAERLQKAAQAHIQAGQLWQQAALAYQGQKFDIAKSLYRQATEASVKAHAADDAARMV
jgi:uncharacterized protein YhjY with autotransporter beta-barrel domain